MSVNKSSTLPQRIGRWVHDIIHPPTFEEQREQGISFATSWIERHQGQTEDKLIEKLIKRGFSEERAAEIESEAIRRRREQRANESI